MRRMIALCMAACMALSLTACGSKDAPSGSAGQGSQSSSASQQETVTVPPVEDLTGVDTSSIPGLEDGVLTVGMECAYAPYNWTRWTIPTARCPFPTSPALTPTATM